VQVIHTHYKLTFKFVYKVEAYKNSLVDT